MAETSLTTDGFLETTSIDPLNEDSLMETGDLNMEEETALLCRNPGEDEETENEIPCAQVNQKRAKKTNKPPIETRKAKLPFDVRPAISSKSNQRNGKQWCKPSTTSRVSITFENSTYPLRVNYDEAM